MLFRSVVLNNKAPYLVRRSGDERTDAFVLGILCSIPFDWAARQTVELHVNPHVVRGFSVPDVDETNVLRERMVDVAGRLAAADERFADWASAVGVSVGTMTDEQERQSAVAELDALASLLYGLKWDDVVHVFETFHRGWDYTERLAAVQVHFDRRESEA